MGLARRSLLRGLLAAPVIIRTPGLLMPVRRVPVPLIESDYPIQIRDSWNLLPLEGGAIPAGSLWLRPEDNTLHLYTGQAWRQMLPAVPDMQEQILAAESFVPIPGRVGLLSLAKPGIIED